MDATDKGKPRLLFVSPVFPAFSGHGTSMRVAATLKAFSHYFDISLLVVNLFRRRRFNQDMTVAEALCSRTMLVPGYKSVNTKPWEHEAFDFVHVCRLISTRFALHYILADHARSSVKSLDLDDYESSTRLRFAELASATGDHRRAEQEKDAAAYFKHLEEVTIPLFEKIFVAGEDDRIRLQRRFSSVRVSVLPNAVALPVVTGRMLISESLTILFVGTLDYFPNEDGVSFFCGDVLPLLRVKCAQKLCVLIVGSRPTHRVRRWAACNGVQIVGEVPSLGAFYSEADVVIVPVRVGGGTRVKIIEAFAYGVPVVTTSAGADGLDVQSERELLVADSPDQFAIACLRLFVESGLRQKLVSNATAWVKHFGCLDQITPIAESLVSERHNEVYST